MALLIFFAVISIFFSFLCSILEAVLLSITPTFIRVKKKEGKSYATTVAHLKENIDNPLIAILTLNTVAHTVGAILVGVQAEKVYGDGNNAVAILSAIMTLLILVVSEIIPKTIGATYWKQLAKPATATILGIVFVLKWTGILWTLRLTTKLIGKTAHVSVISREDFTAMADIAKEEGIFKESESKVIKNLLSFHNILVKDIMTPRPVIKTASEDITVREFYNRNEGLRFSRVPLYHEQPDTITGLVLKTEVLEELIKGNGDKKLSEIKRNILITKRSLPLPQLFEELVKSKNHLALVMDEFGGVSGLVTMEDVIETLLGLEIMDESDVIADLQQLARKNWEQRAQKLGLLNKDNDGTGNP